MSSNRKFVCVLDCMDGRTKRPMLEWIERNIGSSLMCDTITEPGIDGMLVRGSESQLEWLKQKASISYGKHGSRILIIAGHEGCAGNPVSKLEHHRDILASLQIVSSWGFDRIIGLYFADVDGDCTAEKVFDTSANQNNVDTEAGVFL